jgi:hypothetical protein
VQLLGGHATRAGDRTRTGDVQLGKEAENQRLTSPAANSLLRDVMLAALTASDFGAQKTTLRPPLKCASLLRRRHAMMLEAR